MKILHISTFDLAGGAARAAYRIHQGLQVIGLDSSMLVQFKTSDNRNVIAPKTDYEKTLFRLGGKFNALHLQPYKVRKENYFSSQWFFDTVNPKVKQINPDVINLHWVCSGYLRIETIANFNKPVIWTLMDMWPFTGGCHYSGDCERYTKSCGLCPQLSSQKETDPSREIWQRKAKAWKNVNLSIVSPSKWLSDCARSSSLFQNLRIETIPFGLDTSVYKPVDRKIARDVLNLPQDKQLILFGAISATQDRRKGFYLLQPALQELAKTDWKEKIELVIFGASEPDQPVDLGFKTRYLGRLQDDASLILAYSAADVMTVPSTQEAFGQTASEALACGTPVVAFAATGLKDIIDHQQNGYLAEPFVVEDLAKGIAWVLEDPERYLKLSASARQKAEQEFGLELQASRYESLFSEIISKQASKK